MSESLTTLGRRLRGGLASLRAAAETAHGFPDMDPSKRQDLLAVVVREAEQLGTLIDQLDRLAVTTDEPPATTVGTLLDALRVAAGERGLTLDLGPLDKPERTLPADLDRLRDAMTTVATSLRRDLAVSHGWLDVRTEPAHVVIDLAWTPEPGDHERLHPWHAEALGDDDHGLRGVARAHQGEAWFNLARNDGRAHIRVLLPFARGA
ncbi:MAG: hypothetical protein AAGD38_03275 [Acidobacteriota bacterium]